MMDPALRLLLGLKVKGKIRKQVRRLRSPKGIATACLGAVIIALWLGTLAFSSSFSQLEGETQHLNMIVHVGALALVTMTITTSLNHRGIYMPIDELELLLSAPVSRADLVRYRLLASLGRWTFSGVVFGLIAMRRLPHAGYGFFGVLLAMLTLPILGQFTSLMAGAIELKFGRVTKRSRFRYLHLLVVGIAGILFLAFVFGDAFVEQFSSLKGVGDVTEKLANSSFVRTLVYPLKPWTSLVMSRSAGEFFPCLGICLSAWIVAFELTCRLPFDFRELTLETSADVARRIRRVQRTGFGASAGKATLNSVGRRVPWIFGRNPIGAMAWIKLASILRKTRGTLTISILIVALMTVASLLLFDDSTTEDVLLGAILVALFGTIYLCAGLRFDFRTDLDQMEAIKCWPISPRRAFLANLLPQVILVSSLIITAILIRVLVTGGFHPALLGVFAALPLLTLAWIALDNAVFLFAPVRNVAGQEGMLQHMGRSMMLVLLRMVLGGVVFGVAAGLAAVIWLFTDDLNEDFRIALVVSTTATCLLLADVALVFVGGWAFRRFDVSRIPR